MNTDAILAALSIMWKGMAGIFVTIAIIVVAVWIMGKLSAVKKQDTEEK